MHYCIRLMPVCSIVKLLPLGSLDDLMHYHTRLMQVCSIVKMKKVNKQCLLDTPRTVRVSEKTWQVIVQTRRP